MMDCGYSAHYLPKVAPRSLGEREFALLGILTSNVSLAGAAKIPRD
jgi:hypothetical protein